MTLDHPHVRQSSYCPVCDLGKDTGTLMCWGCYRRFNSRYGNADVEARIDRRERELELQALAVATWKQEGKL